MTKKTPSPVHQARERLIAKIDEACIARGLLVGEVGNMSVEERQRYCEQAEQAVRRAITAYARAIRREEKGKR